MAGRDVHVEPPRLAGYGARIYQRPGTGGHGDILVSFPLSGTDTKYEGSSDGWLIALGMLSGRAKTSGRLRAALESGLVRLARSDIDPGSLLTSLDHDLADLARDEDFATMQVAVIDGRRHELAFGNAGMNPPYIRRPGGRVEFLDPDVSGLPFWLQPGQQYKSATVPIRPGDVLVFHTGSVTKTASIEDQGEDFDPDLLTRALAGAPDDVASVWASILGAVRRPGGRQRTADDLTLICLGRSG